MLYCMAVMAVIAICEEKLRIWYFPSPRFPLLSLKTLRKALHKAYHDCKQLLDFGKCQSVHFSAQIASFTLTMMQYNILCTVKRFEAYETIGALFRETTGNTLELSAADRIWELILDTILEIAEIISADASELLSAVIDGNPKFHKLYQMYKLVA